MRYDPSIKGLMSDKYPTLKGITEDDKLLRVVLYMLDEESPFLKEERDDYEKRLSKVLAHVKVDYPDIAEAENLEYNRIATSIFMKMDNLAYVTWQSKLINFHQLNAFLRRPLGTDDVEKSIKDRLAVEKQLPDIHKSLVDYEKQIFPDQFARKVIKEETARLLQFAERFAESKTVV